MNIFISVNDGNDKINEPQSLHPNRTPSRSSHHHQVIAIQDVLLVRPIQCLALPL